MPTTVHNHRRGVRVDLGWLRRFAKCAHAEALKHCADADRAVLATLDEVEISIVSDETIATVHEQFMGIRGPTDVITFDHGEIVISADTALANATRYRHSIDEELALYTLHGLLHLNGFDDRTKRDAGRMRRIQNLAFKACLAKLLRRSH